MQRVTDNSMVTKIQSTLEAISELSSTEMTIVTTVTPTTVETVTDSGVRQDKDA